MKYTNNYSLPQAWVRACESTRYVKKGDISNTSLSKPRQMLALEARYSHLIVRDCIQDAWSILGQGTHYVLQQGSEGFPGVVVEGSFFYECEGWTVSTTLDLIECGVLWDWKVTRAWAVVNGIKPDWEAQLNVGMFLASLRGFDIQALRIAAILRDWNRLEAFKSHNYPQQEIVVIPASIWPTEYTQDWIYEHVKGHQACINLYDSALPPCTEAERWAKPKQYALHKITQKGTPAVKAYRVLTDPQQAEQLKDKLDAEYVIKERPSQNVRCDNYCNVRDFCKQYQRMKGGTDGNSNS